MTIMKKKMTMTLLACLLCGGMASGQGASVYSPSSPDIMLPSPTSRVFQKFTDYPVSPATGTVDIRVPLYTLETGGLSLPFALKYHSSGVRVQDPVGAVGRNWALFPGLKISRTIMSKPDEVYPVTDIGTNPTAVNELSLASPYSDTGENCDCRNAAGGQDVFPRIDGQYDIFRINMEGMYCAFILQRINGEDVVKQVNETPLKITPMFGTSTNFFRNRLYGFEVTDDKGIRYLFGEASPVLDNSQPLSYIERNNGNLYFCGWMLRKVILPGGGNIDFTYQELLEAVPAYNNCTTVWDNGAIKGVAGCYLDDMVNTSTGSDSPFWRYLGNDGYRKTGAMEPPYAYTDRSMVPLKVTFPNGSADFTYTGGKLVKMEVKRTGGTVVKAASLEYDSQATGNLLKGVSLTGEGSYRFSYKNEGVPPQRGFDWWGFYNGQPTHSTNLPSMQLQVIATRGGMTTPETISVGEGADRSPNAGYMDTHSLTSMVNPTGGTLSIAYEPHSYTVSGTTRTGGGIRVKSAAMYDPVSGKTVTRNYTYSDAHYLGYTYPDAKSLVTTRYMCPLDAGYCTVRVRTLSVFPHSPYMRGNLSSVWYGKVTETSQLWKKEYTYSMTPDQYGNIYHDTASGGQDVPERMVSQMNSLLYTSPLLVREDSYRKEGSTYVKVQSLTNGYSNYTNSVTGTIAMPYLKVIDGYSNCQFLETLTACSDRNYLDAYGSPVKRYTYSIRTGIIRPGTTRKVDYHGTDSIVETVTMDYDGTRKYNAVSKTVLKSDGTQETERYYYSNHTAPDKGTLTSAQQTAVGTLTTNNRLTTVVQQETLKGSTKLYSVLYGFDSSSLLKQQYYRKGSGTMGSRMEYRVYDSYRNPVHAVKDGTEHVVYIWGYKGECLVAEIRGATYDAVKTALGCTPESLSSAASPDMTLIDGLRGKLTGATVTTCTHAPLVGPLTRRDANNNVTNYQYDSAGRLEYVKSYDGNRKEKYQYNFRP